MNKPITREGMNIDWTLLEQAFEGLLDPAKQFVLCLMSGRVMDESECIHKQQKENTAFSASLGNSYLSIDPWNSREQYKAMELFIQEIRAPQLKDALLASIEGKGAFSRFKGVLNQYPETRRRWFVFRDALLHRFIFQWLQQQQVTVRTIPSWNVLLPGQSLLKEYQQNTMESEILEDTFELSENTTMKDPEFVISQEELAVVLKEGWDKYDLPSISDETLMELVKWLSMRLSKKSEVSNQ